MLYFDNLVPRVHVPIGQHQDTELWNNQFPETKGRLFKQSLDNVYESHRLTHV